MHKHSPWHLNHGLASLSCLTTGNGLWGSSLPHGSNQTHPRRELHGPDLILTGKIQHVKIQNYFKRHAKHSDKLMTACKREVTSTPVYCFFFYPSFIMDSNRNLSSITSIIFLCCQWGRTESERLRWTEEYSEEKKSKRKSYRESRGENMVQVIHAEKNKKDRGTAGERTRKAKLDRIDIRIVHKTLFH